MKILFIVPNVPSPIRPRPLHFIRGLSQAYQISVLCLAVNETDERFVSELRQHCHKLEVIRLSRWKSLANCFLALFSGTSLRCAYFYSPRLRDRIKALVQAGDVDVVHAEHVKSIPMLQPIMAKVPIVFDAVDCLSMLESRRRAVTKNPLLKVFSWIESKKFSRAELTAAHQFNQLVISSEVDRQAYPIPDGLRERIHVVPNSIDLESFAFRRFEAQKNLVVFCAKLDYFPNEDAALYLARRIWPRVRVRRPELRLDIVGSRPPSTVRELDGKDNIRVIASVPDVRPYVGSAWVALCPIRIRAGIQNKILEAMALGVPVIATPVCCAGLRLEPGKHLLVADGPEPFASAIELLLDNATLRTKLMEAGRAYVERHHNWADSVTALADTYKSAMVDFTTRADSMATAVTVPVR